MLKSHGAKVAKTKKRIAKKRARKVVKPEVRKSRAQAQRIIRAQRSQGPARPSTSKFKKGKSVQSEGSPKGSKNVATLYLESGDMRIPGSIDGNQAKTIVEGRNNPSVCAQGCEGRPKCMKQYIEQLHEFEVAAAAARPSEFPFEREDLEVMRAIYERMQLCKPRRE